jgi:hypothetical protein
MKDAGPARPGGRLKKDVPFGRIFCCRSHRTVGKRRMAASSLSRAAQKHHGRGGQRAGDAMQQYQVKDVAAQVGGSNNRWSKRPETRRDGSDGGTSLQMQKTERRCVEGSSGSGGGETGVVSARGLAMRPEEEQGWCLLVVPLDGRVGELSCCTAPDSAATDAVKHAEFSEPPARAVSDGALDRKGCRKRSESVKGGKRNVGDAEWKGCSRKMSKARGNKTVTRIG